MQHFYKRRQHLSRGTREGQKGTIFNRRLHSSKWYWIKRQKNGCFDSKICHNSDLKITKCMQGSELVEMRMWKTSWKVWNSTWKTGMSTWVLNSFHRVFNLWKKQGRYTMGKALWMWKTFDSGKKTDTRCAERRHLPHAVLSGPQHRNFTGEKSQFYGEHRLLMLYFKMSHHRLPHCGMERFAEWNTTAPGRKSHGVLR